MKIQNFDALATTDGRRALLTIAEAGYGAIDTGMVMERNLQLDGSMLTLAGNVVDLNAVGTLVFVAIGKCAGDAAAVAVRILGDRIARGVVVDVKTCPEFKQLKTFCGTHPLPSTENLRAAEAIVDALQGLTERDLVVFVVSGGGSTLLYLPEDKAAREEVPIMTALIDAGATIQEINVIRKHMSYARGGNLAKAAYPAKVVSLIFSDVVGDDLSSIASGPTVKDESTIADAAGLLSKYEVLKTCSMEKCGLIETPKDEKYFMNVSNILVVSNRRALEAMKGKAEALGFAAEIRSSELVGEADEVGKMLVDAIRHAQPKTALLWAGETTVVVRDPKGSGGRNLEVAASALRFVEDGEEILSFASDGRDHGSFAGAIADTVTNRKAAEAGVDTEAFRAANNTYPLFERIDNYVITGDTGSNVSDLMIALKT